MKYVRGSETWNSTHCHSVAAAGSFTVQTRLVGLQPETGVPPGCQAIAPGGFVAHSAEFDPSDGMAVTVAREPPAAT